MQGVTRALPLLTLLTLATTVALAGCAVPGSVDGIFHSDPFTLRATSPLTKPTASGRDRLVVLAENDSETLSTVSLHLVGFDEMPVNEAVDVGTGAFADHRSSIEVVVGEGAVVDTRADGVELLSSKDPVRSASTGGRITITEKTAQQTSGEFHVKLDDGGYLDGVFTAFPEQ